MATTRALVAAALRSLNNVLPASSTGLGSLSNAIRVASQATTQHRHLSTALQSFQQHQQCATGQLQPSSHAPVTSACGHMRHAFSTSAYDYSKEVDEINELFVAARDEIEYAQEDADTVWFNDSVADAKEVVDECLSKWEALLNSLPDDERAKLQRSMGLKMEQLKAEFDQVSKLHLEDH